MKTQILVFLGVFAIFSSCKLQGIRMKPVIEFLSPIDDISVKIGDTINIIANSYDENGTIDNVMFYADDQLLYTDTDEPYEYDLVFHKSGNHDILLKATDDDNLTSVTDPLKVRVSDLESPDVYVSYSYSYYLEEYDHLTFTITATSPNGSIKKVYLYIDNELFDTTSVNPYVFACDSLTAGTRNIFAVAEDEIGKIGYSSILTLDVHPNSLPSIEFFAPHNGDIFRPGESIHIFVDAYDQYGSIEKVEIYADNLLLTELTEDFEFNWDGATSGNHSIYAKAYDNKGAFTISESITIKVISGFSINGLISDLEYSENDDLVFGLNTTTNKLLLINPNDVTYTEISLPYSQPISMDYSITDQKLYIAYKLTGSISVWDNNAQSLSNMNFSSSSDGLDVKVDPSNRRIYVLTNTGLFILNMDNGSILLENGTVSGVSMVILPEDQLLFTSAGNNSSAVIRKYSVENDLVSLIQTNSDCGANPRKIAINPIHKYVVLPCGSGNGPGYSYTANAYDTENIFNILGEFDFGTYPKFVTFSHDGSEFFGTNGDPYDNYIYVINASSYVLNKKIFLPYSDDYCVMSTNFSGSKVIAFTYDLYNDRYKTIYLLDK